jgi:hypothetical protein
VSTKRTPNRLLAAVMAEAGVSNKGLAARVRELAQRDDRPISSDHVSVRRWLDGSIPRGRTSHYVAVALGAKLGRQVTPADLGLASDAQEVTTTHGDYDPVEISQRAWRDIRNRLIRNRADLASLAVELYEPSWRLPQAPMLSQESWLPDKPVALEGIDLEWESNPPKPIVVGQELSHELSSAVMNGTPSWSELPFRSLISDPYDLSLRSVNNSITTLTIRRDCATGRASFLLLRRDATKVVTGGGEYGLVPGGEFQPASISPDSLLLDLSIWRNMVREYSEELLGQPEHDGSTGRPIDYERWPFFRSMQKARKRGELRVYALGVALNALSLNATVVTVAVIDSIVFDSLFHGLARVNAEGEIVARLGENKEGHDVPFNEATVNHFLHVEPLVSPTTKGGLSLAWRHRAHLLQA